ncbi:toxin-antitoxin system YwqK family antitoxin [Nonlabens sp.]|uniref:toxin-antitoxin system YwqK family antitoxin n=1 Tax=Nonlabens sp. TaxID=1888209 RepID=UPI003F69BBEE
MKKILFLCALFVGVLAMAQDVKPEFEKQNDGTIKATYFYSNGDIAQIGTFNKDNERHGEWISYNLEGQKTAQAEYENGKKAGKWFFWSDEQLTEVDYSNNAIVAVNNWVNKNPVATNRP